MKTLIQLIQNVLAEIDRKAAMDARFDRYIAANPIIGA